MFLANLFGVFLWPRMIKKSDHFTLLHFADSLLKSRQTSLRESFQQIRWKHRHVLEKLRTCELHWIGIQYQFCIWSAPSLLGESDVFLLTSEGWILHREKLGGALSRKDRSHLFDISVSAALCCYHTPLNRSPFLWPHYLLYIIFHLFLFPLSWQHSLAPPLTHPRVYLSPPHIINDFFPSAFLSTAVGGECKNEQNERAQEKRRRQWKKSGIKWETASGSSSSCKKK